MEGLTSRRRSACTHGRAMTRVPGDLLCCARSLGLHRGGVGVKPHISAQVGYDGCTPPQPEYPIVSKTSKPSITLGFRDSKFLSTPGQRFASPPSRGQTIVAIGVTAPAHNACCGRHHRLSAAARGPAVPRCHGSPCPVSTWQSPPTSMMSSCLRTRREGGSVP